MNLWGETVGVVEKGGKEGRPERLRWNMDRQWQEMEQTVKIQEGEFESETGYGG